MDLFDNAMQERMNHEAPLAARLRPRTLDEVTAMAIVYGSFYSPTNSYHDQEWRMIRHHLARATPTKVTTASFEAIISRRSRRSPRSTGPTC